MALASSNGRWRVVRYCMRLLGSTRGAVVAPGAGDVHQKRKTMHSRIAAVRAIASRAEAHCLYPLVLRQCLAATRARGAAI